MNKEICRKRLKELRLGAGLSQAALGKELGMTEQAVQKYEYGERVPAFDKLILFADYFDVSIDYLCGRTDNPTLNR